MDLAALEAELKKRLAESDIPWGYRRNGEWDRANDYVFSTIIWSQLLQHLQDKPYEVRRYAINRWFNYWSNTAVKSIFCSLPGVTPAKDKDWSVDFSIGGIRFDHKTCGYPKDFPRSITTIQRYPRNLIRWLYGIHSIEQRQPIAHRLFVVLCDTSPQAAHWKLRAELALIRTAIEQYVQSFDVHRLVWISNGRRLILSDIIWVVR
jgi:hypothetical protein